MNTEIANTETGTLIPVDQVHDDAAFEAMASSAKYLPRLQLFTANSEAVKEGKIPMAHYALVAGKDSLQDLGSTVDCLPIAWRPKAMDLSDTDNIINCHDQKHPEFQRIVAQADVQDSGCMFGPEFLIWIPSTSKFVVFFMASKTARREAPKVRDRLGRPSTLKAKFIKTTKYSWHGPECTQCSTPFDLPDQEQLAMEVERFNNPPALDVEKAEETSAGRTR